MEPLSSQRIAEIVGQRGYQVVENAPTDMVARPEVDAISPSLAQMRAKFFRPGSPFADLKDSDSAVGNAMPEAVTPDRGKDTPSLAAEAQTAQDAIVLVAPADAGGTQSGPGPKAVVIDGDEGRIIGYQG